MGGARRLCLKRVRVPRIQIDSQSRPKRPPVGGSYCRIPQDRPYVRRTTSLLHYPPVAALGNVRTANGSAHFEQPESFDWLTARDKPSPIEHAARYGPYTLRISGVPFGVTNQELEEQLRRLFFRFGPILRCRSEPHPRDPFQSCGVAHISFKYEASAMQALRQAQFVLRCGLRSSVLHLSSPLTAPVALGGETPSNVFDWHKREKYAAVQISQFARQLFNHLGNSWCTKQNDCATSRFSSTGIASWPQPITGRCGEPAILLRQLNLVPLVGLNTSLAFTFGSWTALFASLPVSQLFTLVPVRIEDSNCNREINSQGNSGRCGGTSDSASSSSKIFAALGSMLGSISGTPVAVPHSTARRELPDGKALRVVSNYLRACPNLPPARISTPFIDRQFRRQQMLSLLHCGSVATNNDDGGEYLAAVRILAPQDELRQPTKQNPSNLLDVTALLPRGIALAVHRRPIPQERAEIFLELVEQGALAAAERRRWARAGGSSTTYLEPDVLLRMKRFFRKPPLPETLQRLSKPEYLYRRIHDEKHILKFNLTERKARETAYAKLAKMAANYQKPS